MRSLVEILCCCILVSVQFIHSARAQSSNQISDNTVLAVLADDRKVPVQTRNQWGIRLESIAAEASDCFSLCDSIQPSTLSPISCMPLGHISPRPLMQRVCQHGWSHSGLGLLKSACHTGCAFPATCSASEYESLHNRIMSEKVEARHRRRNRKKQRKQRAPDPRALGRDLNADEFEAARRSVASDLHPPAERYRDIAATVSAINLTASTLRSEACSPEGIASRLGAMATRVNDRASLEACERGRDTSIAAGCELAVAWHREHEVQVAVMGDLSSRYGADNPDGSASVDSSEMRVQVQVGIDVDDGSIASN